jgi:transketolase
MRHEIASKACRVRRLVLQMMNKSRSSHIGSCLSIIDILQVLYERILNVDPGNPHKEDRDIFILSKAHASAALYATLASSGFFDESRLSEFYIDGGSLPGHLDRDSVSGVEVSAGSLGHGLSIGLGMALARINDRIDSKVFVLVGDGETDEGSFWEAVSFAGHAGIDNVRLIVDNNGLQGLPIDKLMADRLPQKLEAFGWITSEVDGHDIDDLVDVMSQEVDGPYAIVANTTKGKGVSFMENAFEWHYRSPNSEQLEEALKELK